MTIVQTVKCYIRGRHDAERHPLGGFRCRDCSTPSESLEGMGFANGGYVNLTRRVYSRERGEVTRTTAWEPTRRGW